MRDYCGPILLTATSMHSRLVSLVFALVLALFEMPARAGNAPGSEPAIRVGILLFDGVQIIDFAGPYEVFGAADFGVITVSHTGNPVTTAMGLKVTPDASFAEAPAFDVLLVPGGDVADAERDTALLDFVRTRARSSREVLSVCTGAFILASSGLLDGQQATTFTPRIDELARRYPSVHVVKDVRWTDNGRIITSAGLSSGIDAALHVVGRLRGVDAARSVALHLEYAWKPEGGFVRSRLADRYLPKAALQKAVDWPADLVMRQQFSIGDDHQWSMRFDVVSATPAAELVQRIGRGVESLAGWTHEPGRDRWVSDKQGQRVALYALAVPGPTAASYMLELKIATLPE